MEKIFLKSFIFSILLLHQMQKESYTHDSSSEFISPLDKKISRSSLKISQLNRGQQLSDFAKQRQTFN